MDPVDAKYEDGVLRPVRPLHLRPGERVRLVILRPSDPARWDLERLGRTGMPEDVQLAEAGLGDWADALDREDRR